MPTLNMGSGELEGGSTEKKVAKKPSDLRVAMDKAGAILWIIAATVVTGANGQQVAVATVPQQPGQSGPGVPWKAEGTIEEIPTAEMVIEILREGQDLIKKKFSNYNDAAFLRIVGEIGLGTVKPVTLTGLAEAFTEEPDKHKAIIAFSKVVNTPKPAPTLASPLDNSNKLPPLNESPEEKKIRLEMEKQEKLKQDSAKSLTVSFLDPKKWTALVGKTDKAKIKKWGQWVQAEFDDQKSKEQNREGGIGFDANLAPGNYKIKITSTGKPVVAFLYDNAGSTLNPDGTIAQKGVWKRWTTLFSGTDNILTVPNNCRKILFYGSVTPMDSTIIITDFSAEVIKENNIAQNQN